MAIPPEPLDQILPLAELVIDAEVEAIIEERYDAPPVDAPEHWVDVGRVDGSQVVRLRSLQVLHGEPPAGVLTVEKPLAPYRLTVGQRGPFLLARRVGDWVIIGRYGPLYRQTADVAAALRDATHEGGQSDE